MRIQTIHTGNFMLDGGAMFGTVPKSIWQRINPADQQNMCNWAMRCLLVEDGDRLILVDTGMGEKQSEKFFGYYYLNGIHSLQKSLNDAGVDFNDITDVVLTHLHFDHCGGAIKKSFSGLGFEPMFRNAVYWTNKKHWDWAVKPNKREVASFLKENLLPIEQTGRLNFLSNSGGQFSFASEFGFDVFYADGHTEKQMLPIITYKGQKIAFAADLIPTAGHIPLPYVMGYDVRPLTTLKEKEVFLNYAVENNVLLFLEHDSLNEIVSLKNTEKGVRINKILKCNEVF